jgi:hypothetical protein
VFALTARSQNQGQRAIIRYDFNISGCRFLCLSIAGLKAFLGHGRLPDTQNLYVEATPANETLYASHLQ